MSRDLNPKMIRRAHLIISPPIFFLQILTVGLLNLGLCCKLLDVTVSEKDRGGFCPHFLQWVNYVFIGTIRLPHG